MLAHSLGGLLMLAAVVCGLFAMHGLQPSPGPVAAPSVFADLGHDHALPMPMSPGAQHDGGSPAPHDGHGGGQVCLAFLLAGAVLLLMTAASGHRWEQPAVRSRGQALRHPVLMRPRGPTLAQLSVLRL
ncbi:DUF6153 family protein [Planotetraspora thailandica]|uniref:DUF6153 family protein n=1 Tax=Planotetraspora thailandica TaxID=487172 RepID=UPI003570BDA1